MNPVAIIVFTSHGVSALGTVLRDIRTTVGGSPDLAVLADDCPEQVATYLLREYLGGRITGFELDRGGHHRAHCGLDRAYHIVEGEYLVRVDDTLAFQPGWLDKAIAALEADESIGCLSLLPPHDYHRGRGRPRTVHVEPIAVDRLDMQCYVTRHELVECHECELLADQPGDGCRFQEYLHGIGRKLAFLPGLVTAAEPSRGPLSTPPRMYEADLPPHGGPVGSLRRVEQIYEIGDDVLLTCMACGATELDVLAAGIRFCERHDVAIGCWYELRCPECGQQCDKDDLQYRCPG